MSLDVKKLAEEVKGGKVPYEEAFADADAAGLRLQFLSAYTAHLDANGQQAKPAENKSRIVAAADSAWAAAAEPRWSTADQGKLVAIEWWWPNHIPSGKLGLLDGDPGLGKSVILCDLVASATTGRALPDGSIPSRTGGAILYAPEDGYGDTIIPRLKAAGADLSKVLVAHAADFGEPIQLPKDLPTLVDQIEFVGAVLLAFDPWEFYLEADIIKGREQRLALEPINQCIAERNVVLIGTRHLNQQSGQKALYRGRGDITGIGVSRYGFIVGKDPKSEDPDDHVMVPHKHNLAPRARVRAVKYRVEEAFLGEETLISAPRISWNGASDVTPDQALGTDDSKPQTAREIMEEQILPRLQADGPMPSDEGWDIMAGFGIKGRGNVNRARERLGILARKRLGVLGGDWYWLLPGQQIPEETQTPKYESYVSSREGGSGVSLRRDIRNTPTRSDSSTPDGPDGLPPDGPDGLPADRQSSVAGEERCECGLPRASNGRCISGHEFRPTRVVGEEAS